MYLDSYLGEVVKIEVKEAIEKRKSIRSYKQEQVPFEYLKEMIDAARLAPTARNVQPTRFKIIESFELRNKLKEEKIFPQDFVTTAPCILVCYGNPDDYLVKLPDASREDNIQRIERDIAIQTAFLMLRATDLGLGTCYIALLDKERIKPIVGIPDDLYVAYAITVGYSDEEGRERNRLDLDQLYDEEK